MRYYMRSFSMTVKQLREIFAFMISNSLGYQKLRVLLDKTSPFRDDDTLFLRYIGRTRRDPLQRHQEDIRKGGPSNFVYAFMLTADRLFPAIFDSCTIFELEQFQQEPDLADDALKATQTLPSISNEQTNILELEDLCEQLLMALFGMDFVLNTTMNCAWSANGSTHDTVLSDNHYLKFQTLDTKVFPFLRREHFKNASIEIAEKVSGWAKAIQSYAAAHQHSVSTYRNKTYNFSDQLREMIAEQAMPATLGEDMNLLLLVGAGIPSVAYQHAQNLWTHPTPFANMLKTLFSRLQEWELPITTPQNCQTPIDLSIFPFVDFCPWLKAEKAHLKAAIRFLKTYVVITRPLIILTFVEAPSRAVMTDFQNARLARRGRSFLDDVCSLHLVSYEGSYSIQIASLRPSASRFSRKTALTVTVINLTFWLVLLTISTFVRSRSQYLAATRYEWCCYVKAEVERTISETKIDVMIREAKEELRRDGQPNKPVRPRSGLPWKFRNTDIFSRSARQISCAFSSNVVCPTAQVDFIELSFSGSTNIQSICPGNAQF